MQCLQFIQSLYFELEKDVAKIQQKANGIVSAQFLSMLYIFIGFPRIEFSFPSKYLIKVSHSTVSKEINSAWIDCE